MTDEELKQAIAELQEVVRCRCDEAYRDRGLKDPHCECDSAEAVKIVARRIKDLTAKLAKAVEALEPFAKAAETWEPDDGDSGLGARIEHPHHGLERHAEFTFGDLRRARATLAAVSETHKIKGESHDPL